MADNLESQLLEAGNVLLEPPSSPNQLLTHLDRVGKLLGQVDQSPSKSMLTALSPTIKAVVKEPFLGNENEDVRVAVASCINEITRITAPDAPYDDNLMKDIFQLIVSSFENLSDKSSQSYFKRISILETVAKVRSCVVMLDLECDGLIVEMFQHFLKSIRDYHPENVFSSMEVIMTLVLEESEDVGRELISPILASLKKDNLEVQPIARKLAESVIGKCATKIKPCLLEAKSSMNFSCDDYSAIISEICEESNRVRQNNHKSSGEQLDQETKESEAETLNEQDHPPPVESGPGGDFSGPSETGLEDDHPILVEREDHPAPAPSFKSATSNGVAETENEDVSMGPRSSEKPESTNEEDRPHDAIYVGSKAESGDSDSMKVAKVETKSVTKKRSKKPNRPMKAMVPTESSCTDTDTDKEAKRLTDEDIVLDKKVCASPSTDPSTHADADVGGKAEQVEPKSAQVTKKRSKRPMRLMKSAVPTESSCTDTDTDKEAKQLTGGDIVLDKKVNASPSRDPSAEVTVHKENDIEIEQLSSPKVVESGLDEGRSRKDRRSKNKKESSKKSSPSEDVASKMASEGTKRGRSGKKALASDSLAEKAQVPVPTSRVEGGSETDSDVKIVKKSSRMAQTRDPTGDGSSSKKKVDGKQRVYGKVTPENVKAGSSSKSSKVLKDDSPLKETPKSSSKRKHTPLKEKASDAKKHGEDLVGAKIKVWWPIDKEFYEGVVDSFDTKSKKHRVVYDDGELEDLNLGEETWNLIEDDDSMGDGEDRETRAKNPEASLQMQKKKKTKTSSESSAKKGKIETLRDGKASSSGAKGTGMKSGRKEDIKSTPKSSAKSDDRSKKSGGKSSVDALGKASKSKDEDNDTPKRNVKFTVGSSKTVAKGTPKSTNKDVSKTDAEDSLKTAIKSGSKSNTSKSGSKSNTSGAGKGKSGSGKSKETKEKESPEVVKAVKSGKRKSEETTTKGKESEGKSGKKQKRS